MKQTTRTYNKKPINVTWKLLTLDKYPEISELKTRMSYGELTKHLTKQGYKSNTGRPLREITVNAFLKSCGHTTNPALAWSKKDWATIGSTADSNYVVNVTRELANGTYGISPAKDLRAWNPPANHSTPLMQLAAIREVIGTNISESSKLTLISAVTNV